MPEREEEEEDGALGEAADACGTELIAVAKVKNPPKKYVARKRGMAICVRGAPGTKYSKIAPAMYVTPEVIANPSSQAGPPRRP